MPPSDKDIREQEAHRRAAAKATLADQLAEAVLRDLGGDDLCGGPPSEYSHLVALAHQIKAASDPEQ